MLAGSNNYAGDTNVFGGTLVVSGGSAIPDTSSVTLNGGRLKLLNDEVIRSLTGSGVADLGVNTLTVTPVMSGSYSGTVVGAGNLSVQGVGTFDTFTLTNSNSDFTGGVTIAGGNVSVPRVGDIGVKSPLGSAGPIALGDDKLPGGLIVTQFSGSIGTNRPFRIEEGGGSINIANTATEFALTGPLDGTGAFSKLGAGKLRLVGDKNYSGMVIVDEGKLELGGNVPASITVRNGATLTTSGAQARTIAFLTLTGGVLSLGGTGTAATLNTGNVILDGGRFDFDLEGSANGHDQLNVTGSVLLKGYVALTINLGVDPEDFKDVYRLVLNDGTDITTVFDEASRFVYQGNVLEEGETFLVTSGDISQYFQMHYGLTPEDNDIRIVAAPEPGSAAMLAGGMLCLLGRRKRRLRA